MNEPSTKILALAALARKEPGVEVKLGQTNGRECVHLIKRDFVDPPPRLSYTIYDAHEWDEHPWNGWARKEKREPSYELREAVANREAQ